MSRPEAVESASELMEAGESGAEEIEARGTLSGMPTTTLRPGVWLHGGISKIGARNVRLPCDNAIDCVTVLTDNDGVGILNDTATADLGTLRLGDVHVTGQVHLILIADAAVRAGHVHAEGLRITRADVRCRRVARALHEVHRSADLATWRQPERMAG